MSICDFTNFHTNQPPLTLALVPISSLLLKLLPLLDLIVQGLPVRVLLLPPGLPSLVPTCPETVSSVHDCRDVPRFCVSFEVVVEPC